MAPLVALAIGLACLVVARLLFLALRGSGERWAGGPSAPLRTMVVLGSGGHTAEMLTMTAALSRAGYAPRCYVVAATDNHSAEKALAAEKGSVGTAADALEQICIARIPRSREVGQSFTSSIFTTLVALVAAFSLVARQRPDLVLVNGPGTCIPICASAFLLRALWLSDCRVVYVESIARTASLSLSGRILYHSRVADVVMVQWPALRKRYPRSRYAGRVF